MAAPKDPDLVPLVSTICARQISSIEETVLDSLKSLQDVNLDKNRQIVRKKLRDLRNGDMIIPKGVLKLSKELQMRLMKLVQEKLVNSECSESMVASVAVKEFTELAFFLRRPALFKAVIQEVQAKASYYGHSGKGSGLVISLMSIFNKCHISSPSSLADLRLAILESHVKRLLEANGYSVTSISGENEELSQLLSETSLGQTRQASSFTCENSDHGLREHIIEKAKKFLVDEKSISLQPEEKNKFIDLQAILASKSLAVGKESFDKNLHKIQVIQDCKATPVLEDVIDVAIKVTNVNQNGKPVSGCIYLVPQHLSFKQQQVHILCNEFSDISFQQSHLIVGPVSVLEEPDGDAYEVYSARYEQMHYATEARLSEADLDAFEKEAQINLLTHASITVDVLNNASHSSLSFDGRSSETGAEGRLGAFILYNTARLATLLARFDEKVRLGEYPPLPSVDEIDWSLLREENDWELMYLHVAHFPEIVSQAVGELFPSDDSIRAKIFTHKITNFLASFCKCLSAHYSRYHILTSGKSHQLPLMYARIYLMKACHQTLVNCLDLLAIKPLTHL